MPLIFMWRSGADCLGSRPCSRGAGWPLKIWQRQAITPAFATSLLRRRRAPRAHIHRHRAFAYIGEGLGRHLRPGIGANRRLIHGEAVSRPAQHDRCCTQRAVITAIHVAGVHELGIKLADGRIAVPFALVVPGRCAERIGRRRGIRGIQRHFADTLQRHTATQRLPNRVLQQHRLGRGDTRRQLIGKGLLEHILCALQLVRRAHRIGAQRCEVLVRVGAVAEAIGQHRGARGRVGLGHTLAGIDIGRGRIA
mmetsp:Transcript_22989/g.38802  ORF Transcript_22989/g.38802 Transcript_22989/m.38802 type:complete len:252 (-) Transcript_22989:907-1662(-)